MQKNYNNVWVQDNVEIAILSQKIYNNCDMNYDTKSLVLKKIDEDKLESFSCFDFVDIASYKTINKCLERMEDGKEIVRIINGVYRLNKFSEVLHLPVIPSMDNIASTIARKHGWKICPEGNVALNMIGLSTQVPSQYVYLSSGPYKNYKIFNSLLVFKRTTNRELLDYSYITLLIIQSIKALGKNHISDRDINFLNTFLSNDDKKTLLKETKYIQTWIRNIIVKICIN